MDKKLSKAIISIDGVAQSPIAFTKLSYTYKTILDLLVQQRQYSLYQALEQSAVVI